MTRKPLLPSPTLIVSVLALAGSAGSLALADAERQETKPFTAEHVFDLEYGDDPQISPDGSTIVYVRRSMDRVADRIRGDLWTLEVSSGAHRPLVTGGASASGPQWSPDGTRLLYQTSDHTSNRSGNQNGNGARPELRLLYLDTGRSVSLAQFFESPRQVSWSPDGTRIAFSMFVKDEAPSFAKPPAAPEGADWSEPVRVFDDITFRFDGRGYLTEGTNQVFVLPADGGTPRQVTRGEGDFSAPAWLDEDTLLVVANRNEDRELDPIEADIFSIELDTPAMTRLTDRDGPDLAPTPSPDGDTIAYLGYDDELKSWQQLRLYLMGADGSNPRQIAVGFDREFSDLAWRADGKALFALVEDAGDMKIVQVGLDGEVTTAVENVGGTSIGRPYAAGAYSVSSGRRPVFAYTAASPDSPAEIGVAGGGVTDRILTRLNDDLLPHLDMARIERVQVPSRHDGLEIEAWVALPPGFEANGTRPMILEIHGGPFAMYGPTFSAEIQRYAAEGYVVVYVNPRGSTGYGEAFAQEIDLAYPGNDYEDLMSVVDHLVERRYVDADRLFVTGGSGGGVLTAWIVGKTDRFAAAASIKPVINWMTMALSADIAAFVKRHWIRADPWEDPDAFLERSPIMLVGNVTTPTLLMVGEEDWRTPTWEAEQFYTALKLRGVETALIRVPGAPHYIAGRPSRLIAKTDNIMGWFERFDPTTQDED